MNTSWILTILLLALVLNLAAALVRVLRGPSPRDRLLGVLLAGTTGAAALATASILLEVPALRDVALTIVALAAVVVITRVGAETARRQGAGHHGGDP